MKNLFAVFVKEYSSLETVSKELDNFCGNNSGMISSLSAGELIQKLHDNIKDTVFNVVRYKLTSKVVFEQEILEKNEREKLLYELEKNIRDHTTISADAKFNKTDVANHFVTEVYDPLFNTAKIISDIMESPEVKSKFKLTF